MLQTTLKIYDILGNEVATLVNEKKTAGNYEVKFNASNLASGVYLYCIAIHLDKLQSGSFVQTKKFVLMK
ncbi:MAG: T9SS type A sorting domain-containing protein [Bacteroidetes bacterium]|nr:T9SS type A sorting domain-containing protein [Bacteroidota bacterium]MBU1113493.1 T9SS type A sorting domain-containing protein [Bacteroidota bacterium]MBU1798386.1 T9SS type A sorting domain-containing protein [Bacteroidota bacterium]